MCDLVDVAAVAVHEDDVEVAARRELGAAVPTDGNERDVGLVAEQLGEPLVDEARRTRGRTPDPAALVGQELLASFVKIGVAVHLAGRTRPTYRR